MVDLAIATYGQLDGVITNAGLLGLSPVTSLDPEVWDRTFRTNVDAVFFLLKYALPEMLKRLGEPEDFAKLVLFLVSDDASWITGSAFTIDGGILAGG